MIYEIDEDFFNPVFLPFIDSDHKIQLFTGNRGSGKSIFLYQRAIFYAINENYFRLVFCRKVSDTIRKSTFQGLKDIIEEWGLADRFHIIDTAMTIIYKSNGNMMIAHGLDKPEKLKGIKDPTHILFDEMTESTFEDYAQLSAILRTEKAKTAFWGTFNPEHGFWGREYFFLDSKSEIIPEGVVPAKTEDTLIFKASFKTNPFINTSEYEQKLEELASQDDNYRTVWIDGNWGSAITGGEFFRNFKITKHTGKVPYITGLPVHITFDFNVLPYMTMLCSQIIRTMEGPLTIFTVRFFKEYCLADPFNTTEACCLAFLEDYKEMRPDIFIYGDASGNKREPGSGSKTEFKKVRELFSRYMDDASDRTNRSNPSVLQSRNFMNKIFAEQEIVKGVVIRIIVDSEMTTTIADFKNTKVGVNGILKEMYKDPKTGQTWEKWAHCVDGARYLVVKVFEDYFKRFAV